MNSLHNSITSYLTPSASIYKIIYNLVLIVGGALALTISSYIIIPLYPVPVTLQTYVILMIGLSYGWKRATATVGTFLSAGALGLPVFADGLSGMFFRLTTGGYLAGFFVAALVLGLLTDKYNWDKSLLKALLAVTIGISIIFVLGLSWLSVMVPSLDSISKLMQAGLYPFIIGELVKIILVGFSLPLLWKLIKRIQPKNQDL